MSVEKKVFLGIGKLLETQKELIEFLKENELLTTEDSIIEFENEFEDDYSYCGTKWELDCACMNAFTGNGWFIGYKVPATQIGLSEIANLYDMWDELFSEPADFVNEVMYY